MVTKFSHVPIFVLNQNEALDFYVNKLGFEVRTDMTMETGFRWLTIGPKTQPDLEVILYEVGNPMMPPEAAECFRTLLGSGQMGAGVFTVEDCHASYNELLSQGVKFVQEPTDKFYGIEAVVVDPSGNWFSMTQVKPH